MAETRRASLALVSTVGAENSLLGVSAVALATAFPLGLATDTLGVASPSTSADNAVAHTVVRLNGLSPYSADRATLIQ